MMKLNRLFPVRIAWTWAMVLIGIVLYSMMWFVFGRVAFEVITAMEASYTFPSPAQDIVTLLKYIIAWHPLLAIFGWLLWGYINSSRRSVREYEV